MRAAALGVASGLALALTLAQPLTFAGTVWAEAPKARRSPGALVLVIDRSLTMQGPSLAAMKTAALASVAALAPDDQLAVVAFDSEAEIVVPLQRPAKHARIARAIGSIRPEGGTNLYTGLRAAHSLLAASPTATKHVILMTDGDAPDDGLDALVAEMREAGQTLSILAIPPAPPRTATCCRSGDHAARTLMTLLAKGSGRFYFVDDLPVLARTAAADTRLALY